MDNFRFSSSTNGQTTNFRLHNEQSVNGLRKIAWASVFCLIFFVNHALFEKLIAGAGSKKYEMYFSIHGAEIVKMLRIFFFSFM
jgi:hypothetical protein